MRSSVERTADDPADHIDAIALLKREAEQGHLDNAPADGKLNNQNF